MNNKNITVKERNLLKGAIRRVFSRSELRLSAIKSSRVPGFVDSKRPRVTKWSKCISCASMVPEYLMDCDHINPIVPVDSSLDKMTWDELIDRIWCDKKYLQPMCKPCHTEKTKKENKLRRLNMKERKA